MPARLSILTPRSVAFRTRPVIPQKRLAPGVTHRFASDAAKDPQGTATPKGPNEDQLPHVSEEQAAIDKSMGATPPDLEQGTPIQEVLNRDPESQKHAPEIIKKQMNQGQKRSYSTSARRNAEEMQLASQSLGVAPVEMQYPDGGFGHKFPLPDISSILRTDKLKKRYDPVVDQVTKSLMRHGKLSQAQKNMSLILDSIRRAAPPQLNPQFPSRTLVTNQPRETLPLDPVRYLTAAIDSVAPLIKIRQQRGVAGGGASLPIPVPLGLRQRRRTAIQWILASADSRRDIKLADRVAKEIINVAEGRGGAWEKRALVHKLGISARANIRQMLMVRQRKFQKL